MNPQRAIVAHPMTTSTRPFVSLAEKRGHHDDD
jgi:hypothetical protein